MVVTIGDKELTFIECILAILAIDMILGGVVFVAMLLTLRLMRGMELENLRTIGDADDVRTSLKAAVAIAVSFFVMGFLTMVGCALFVLIRSVVTQD